MRYSNCLPLIALVSALGVASSFSTSGGASHQVSVASSQSVEVYRDDLKTSRAGVTMDTISKSALAVFVSLVLGTTPVHADEYGRETEAPTLFTGETTMICVKRGPLGACTKTEYRTAENDNDKSDQYFKVPTEVVKRKDEEARTAESSEGNALIQKLKKQTEDNREKNELLVQQRTFMNDQSASFGPFDKQVLILNVDGKGFTLLENPQAMRLKDAGFIKDKKFVKQPTEQELNDALTAETPSFLQKFFGE